MKCLVTVFLLLTSLLSEVASTKVSDADLILRCLGDCEKKFKGKSLDKCRLECNRGDFNSLLQTDADKGNKVQLYSAVNEGRVRIMNNESGKKNVNVYATKSGKAEDTTDASKSSKSEANTPVTTTSPTNKPTATPTGNPVVFVPLQPRSIPVKPVPTPAEVDPPAPTPEVKPRSGAKYVGVYAVYPVIYTLCIGFVVVLVF